MLECYNCGYWDSNREGCTCPSTDKWFACPIKAECAKIDFKEDFNCEILVTQGNETNRYRFDDYRIATAIENLLHNMECVDFKHDYKKESTDESKTHQTLRGLP